MEPLAKPSGITLRDHRQHVLEEAERLLGLRPEETRGFPYLARKYAALVPDGNLGTRVRTAAWYHDRGKEHSLWQSACRKDYCTYRAWREAHGLDPDRVDAGDYARFECDQSWRYRGEKPGQHLRDAGLRHEFASLKLCAADPKVTLSLAERVAIAAHHAKLGASFEHRWLHDDRGAFADLWRGFQRESYEAVRGFRGDDLRASLLRRYELAGVRALLRLADMRASRAEAGGVLAPLVPFRYDWPQHWTRRPVQDLALEHADEPVTILRAPTGSGKTGAALLWGQHQIEQGRAERVVIAMPTRFTANALAIGAEGDIAETGLYHSSAWYARFGDEPYGTDDYEIARERHAMARLLATPLSVCTVDHLLLSLTGAREDHHATFFFLAHAAVVFDEVDFYDAFVQANLVVLLDALRILDVPVLLMSATVPDSARRLYGVPADVRESSTASSGVRWLHRHTPVTQPGDAADVLSDMIEAGTGIVYANTVERAYRYWAYLTDRAGDLPVYLYHSRFTEPDKKRVEEGVVGALGFKAWQEGRARGIAVLTQIGEMSINISAPLMLSDLCPWDRLAQRAGRLARFEETIPEGTLYVADPLHDGKLYPAPYGAFKNGWTAGAPFLDTRARIEALTADDPLQLTPRLLVEEVDRLYPEPESPDARTRDNTAALYDLVRGNWMIVPATGSREDEADVPGRWKSRDIPPQTMLLVLDPDTVPAGGEFLSLPNYGAWHRLELERGVACPAYLRDRALKRGWVTGLNYTIGDDPEPQRAFWCIHGYEAPDARGIGGGLGALAVREREDTVSEAML